MKAGTVPCINVWQAARDCAPGFVAHKSAPKDGELFKETKLGNLSKLNWWFIAISKHGPN